MPKAQYDGLLQVIADNCGDYCGDYIAVIIAMIIAENDLPIVDERTCPHHSMPMPADR